MLDKSKIEKFYRTEKERLEKIRANQSHIHEFWRAMKDEVLALEKQKIRFCILHMNFSQKEPILHAVLYKCCGHTGKVDDIVFNKLEKSIITNTKFTKVIWE